MARFKLYDRVYTTAALDELTLKDLVLFNSQAEEIGMARKWSDVERISAELSELSTEEADQHPERLLIIAVTVWATRRTAGDQVTFGEAIDFPLSAIEFLPEPQDRKPGKRKGAAKKAPAKSTPTSAPADESPADAEPLTT